MIFITIGPRQIAGWSRSIRKPRLISFTPCASSGMILLVDHRRRLVHAHHARDVRPVDVGVHQPDARARVRERDGEVDRDRRLADAALAARDGDDAARGSDTSTGGGTEGRGRGAAVVHHRQRRAAAAARAAAATSRAGILHVDAHRRSRLTRARPPAARRAPASASSPASSSNRQADLAVERRARCRAPSPTPRRRRPVRGLTTVPSAAAMRSWRVWAI